MKLKNALYTLTVVMTSFSCWAVPIVSNVQMKQIEGTKDVRITYDLADNFNTQLWVTVSAQPTNSVPNWGTAYFPMSSVEGDVRCWVSPGKNKEIIWHAGKDWNGRYTDKAKATIDVVAPIKDIYCICPDGNLRFSSSGFSVSGGYVKAMSAGNSSYYQRTLRTTVHGSGVLSFKFLLENSYGSTFILYVDEVEALKFSQQTGWSNEWRTRSYAINGSGYHTIVWCYYGTSSYGCFIDDVVWR